jgi:hypothetical protein
LRQVVNSNGVGCRRLVRRLFLLAHLWQFEFMFRICDRVCE